MRLSRANGLAAAMVMSATAIATVSAPALAQEQTLEQRVQQLESVRLTGGFRLNYTYKDWDESQEDRGGDFLFNQINLGVEAEHKGVRLSSQYRWYDGIQMIHHLYFATNVDENSEVQVGLMKVPFGIQPYESRSYWGDNALYLGMNDDYDSGIKYITQRGDLNVQVAYYAGGDVAPNNPTRFSTDVISDGTPADNTVQGQFNEEAHQFNIYSAYQMGGSEIGASAQYTGLYNSGTGKMGNAWQAAVHLNGQYGPFGVQTQAARYEYNPENPEGVSDKTVQLGSFGETWSVASKANVYVLNLAYELPLKGGIVDSVTLFNDYNLIDKDESDFKDSEIGTLGLLVVTGNLYTNFDVTMGKNALFVGRGDATTALAEGDGHDDWDTFFNIQFGYYF